MLTAQDIVVEHTPTGPRPVAVFDLTDRELAAAAEALDSLRRERYAHPGLDADDILGLTGLRVVTDQIETLTTVGMHGTLRLPVEQVHLLAEAVGGYLLRDTESYQPPELRARLELLRPIAGELLDLVADLRRAQQTLDEHGAEPHRY